MNDDAATWWAITFDTADPRRLAMFWSNLFAVAIIEPGSDRPDWLRVRPLGAGGPSINFQPVDGPAVGKARLHLDVLVGDLEAAVERVVSLGGSDSGTRQELPRGRIAVMGDADGNVFCLLAPPGTSSAAEPSFGGVGTAATSRRR